MASLTDRVDRKQLQLPSCKKAYYPLLDCLKALLAIAIVAIHAQVFPMVIYPWARLAVPLFFLMSAYFFFLSTKQGKYKAFIIRLLKLYFAWFLISIPVTLYLRYNRWFVDGGIWRFVMDLMFSSTFQTSWFFSALILAVSVVYVAQRFVSPMLIIPLAFVLYSFSCICSSYRDLIFSSKALSVMYNIHSIFASPMYCVTAAILPVTIDAVLARMETKVNVALWGILVLLGGCALYAEWLYVYRAGSGIGNDCYFTLPLVYVPLFLLVSQANVYFPYGKFLRLFSIVCFPLHINVFYWVRSFKLASVGDLNVSPLWLCVFAVTAAIGLSLLILKIEARGSRWLSWLH